jgi:PDZ domain
MAGSWKMRIDGGSIRRRTAYRIIAAGAAILIVTRTGRAAAIAADARPADSAAAAALYEPEAPDAAATSSASKVTPAAAKAGSASTPASASSASASSDSSVNDDFAPAPTKSLPLAPVTTETVIVPASMPAPTYVKQDAGMPPSTTEIPQYGAGPQPGTAEIESSAPDTQRADYAAQHPEQIDPKLRSLQEFMDEDDQISPLGMQLREDQRKLNSGEVATGLLVVAIRQHSAAAIAGLHAINHTPHDVVAGLAVAAALFFPPAVLAIPIMEQVSLGESYDLIIGVDGTRVTNYLDFEDRMRDIQPGEIVYLSIVRDGKRVQVPVHVQALPQYAF